MIERYVDAVSTYAQDIDALFLLIFVLVGFWFVLAEGVFLYFIVRFRARDGRRAQYITGEEKEQKRWVTVPHLLVLVCDIFIIYGAIQVWYDVKQTLPEADAKVRVTGTQWAWIFQHPGPDGALDTDDDITIVDELHIQQGLTYHYELEANDVLHSFSVPVFRLKQDAIPGRSITGWFEARSTGTYDVQCAEMCGIGHGLMAARIVIESPEQHAAWMAEHGNPSFAAATVAPTP